MLKKKTLLIFGILTNLALLGYFKYADFFIVNYNRVTQNEATLLHLALPLAISFYTFQQIGYLVDSYRGETKEYNFLNYTLFVTFFPQLIAGPIVHHSEMMPQFSLQKSMIKNYQNISMGLFIFTIGLFKKVVIADSLGIYATIGFDHAPTLYFIEAWATSLSYTFQLYFDFSGYTDMAIGIALLFNIKLPINFNSPYKALDIQDFWRRWHITLSRFLRDYIYIPLGGSQISPNRTYINLIITFFWGGIWHGAGWTFILWGMLHGIALVIHRLWKQTAITLPKILAWIITFNFLNITWVFFRANNWESAFKVLSGMANLDNIILPEIIQKNLGFLHKYGIHFGKFMPHIKDSSSAISWILFSFILVLTFKNSNVMVREFKANYFNLIYSLILFLSFLLLSNRESEFLYFNF